MTTNAKDKALELVLAMANTRGFEVSYHGLIELPYLTDQSKQCAVICVNEIIASDETLQMVEYWNDVIKEIEYL